MENPIPKWLVGVLGVLLIVFVAMLVVEKGDALSDKFKNKKPANTLQVSGEGKVDAVPDVATVTIGVMSQGKTAADVKDENNRKASAIIDFIKKQGVEDKDIKTTNLSLNPQQDWTGGRAVIVGYQGNQTVTVKFLGVDKNQDRVEKVLDGVVAAGANEVYGPYFSFNDPDDLKQQARKLAIAKAKEKAQELAQEAGLTLGKIVSVSESGGYYPTPMMYGYDKAVTNQASEARAVAPSMAPTIEPGQTEITQTMTVVFEVK
jgi:uncharacterized protein